LIYFNFNIYLFINLKACLSRFIYLGVNMFEI